jgi:hypothetical protein
MNKEFREWFVTERARALAMVLLTRRDDLVVTEAREETGLDYTVRIKTAGNTGNRPFGVSLTAAMTPVEPDVANRQLTDAVKRLQAVGPFHFPVCMFFFTVKDDQGYWAWGYEPVVTGEGQPRLPVRATVHGRKLNIGSLEDIVSAVTAWYDAFDATMTSAGNIEEETASVNK